jgi:hypothetical protein
MNYESYLQLIVETVLVAVLVIVCTAAIGAIICVSIVGLIQFIKDFNK